MRTAGMPGAEARAAGDRAGAGHERVGAPVDVAHRAELALEQDPVAALERLVDDRQAIDDVRRQPFAGREVRLGDPLGIGGLGDERVELRIAAGIAGDDPADPRQRVRRAARGTQRAP